MSARRTVVAAIASLLLLATTACGLLPERETVTEEKAESVALDPVPACNSFDLGPVFDAYGGPDPDRPPSQASIGSRNGCSWAPVDQNVGFTAKVTVGEHPDLSEAAVLQYAQTEWADATGGEPFPAEQYRPGENGWSYGMTSTVPIIQILESHWLTLLTKDGALRCHFWGFDDVTVAWAACDAIRAAITPAE